MHSRRVRPKWFGAALLAASLALSSSVSLAAGDDVEEGYVVALENGDVVVDLSSSRGAAVGDSVEIWRPLSLTHPVTRKKVRDRFRFGSLRLTQVREQLSLARPEGALSRVPAAGDIVVLRRAVRPLQTVPAPKTGAPAATKPEPQPVQPTGTMASADPEERAVGSMFDSLRNASLTTRIRTYEAYVSEHPKGRFAAVLWEEAQFLRRLFAGAEARGSIGLTSFEEPKEAVSGRALSIGVETSGPAIGAVLHARHLGEVAYVTTPLANVGTGYFAGRLPGARVVGQQLQYFIEATDADGRTTALIGSADEPRSVEIHSIPKPKPPTRPEATVSVWTDYADYNRMRGNDVVWQTEGYAGMRFGDVGIRALRSGFGVFRGVGGSLEELDELNKSARRVGLSYGYLEGEYAVTDFTAIIARGVVGLRDDGVTTGAQAMLRLGSDRKTNLTIGGEVLGGIGLRGITQLELRIFERLPIIVRTEVTNQPAGTTASVEDVDPDQPDALPTDTSLSRGEVGARAIIQVGYEVWPGLVVSGRGSYQGRTIKHAGPGFGGAVTYTW